MTGIDGAGRSSPVLRKALVTFVIGAITYAVTEFLVADQGLQLLVTVFVGGVTLVIQFMIDSDRRIAGFEKRLGDFSEATRLLAQLEQSAWHSESVLDLVRHTVAMKSSSGLVHDFVEAEVARLSELLQTLSDGYANYDGEDRDWILSLTRHARIGIDAISTPQTDAAPESAYSFWISDLGQRFLIEQAVAAQRIPVRRVFVLQRGESSANSQFLRICAEQVERGLEVRWIDERELQPDLRAALVGLILFDEVLSYETMPPQSATVEDRPSIVSTQLVTRSRQVDARRRLFQSLWTAARPVSPARAPSP